jgi:hypothetical protein
MDKPGGGYAGAYFTSTDGGKPTSDWGMMYQGWEPVSGRLAPGQVISPFVTQLRQFANNVRASAAAENSLQRNLNTIATVEPIGKSLLSGNPEKIATR